ncbi:hypothetical protein ABW636_21650 [Aquimarina sp. 2201CG1-2-11]|uniref:hypothetical protein n=1 Tax=Aquimarina discodermiae TaxID=3231043 RepID=UPI00346243AD
MKSYIEKWIWIAENDSALEFVYFLESLGTKVSFNEVYKHCDLQEKLKIRNSIIASETCEQLAINYSWKNGKIKDSSLFADAILTLSLIIIDCHNNRGSSDLTIFTGAEKTISFEYDKNNIEILIDSLHLLNAYLIKFFGFSFYEEEDNETKEAKATIIEIIEELENILN